MSIMNDGEEDIICDIKPLEIPFLNTGACINNNDSGGILIVHGAQGLLLTASWWAFGNPWTSFGRLSLSGVLPPRLCSEGALELGIST